MYTLLTSFGCIKGLFNLKNAALLNPTLTDKLYWSFIYFLPYIFLTKFIKHQITGHLFIFYCTFFREFVNISKSCLPLIRNSYPLRKHVLWKLKTLITSEQAQAKWSLIAKKLTENGFCSFCDWLPNFAGIIEFNEFIDLKFYLTESITLHSVSNCLYTLIQLYSGNTCRFVCTWEPSWPT